MVDVRYVALLIVSYQWFTFACRYPFDASCISSITWPSKHTWSHKERLPDTETFRSIGSTWSRRLRLGSFDYTLWAPHRCTSFKLIYGIFVTKIAPLLASVAYSAQFELSTLLPTTTCVPSYCLVNCYEWMGRASGIREQDTSESYPFSRGNMLYAHWRNTSSKL